MARWIVYFQLLVACLSVKLSAKKSPKKSLKVPPKVSPKVSPNFGKTEGLGLCRPEFARERKNFMDMNQGERERLFRAIKKLNEPGRKRGWSYYADMHVKYFELCHFTNLFLVWHRVFLYQLEKDLQSVDKRVTLPYWDWTRHSQKPDEDPVLSKENFGGGGQRKGQGKAGENCVKDGAFRDFMVEEITDGRVKGPRRCLLRNPDVFQKAFLAPELMEKGVLSQKTMMEFSSTLESGGHAFVHSAMGLDFEGKSSPRDPLFFLHHTFIDKLWYDYQKRNFGKQFPSNLINSTRLLPPWNINPMHLMDPMTHMCYYYKQNTFSWDPTYRPYTRRTASNKQPTADQTIGLASKAMDKVALNFTLPASTIEKVALNPHLQETVLTKGSVAPGKNDREDICNIRIPDPLTKKYMAKMKLSLAMRKKVVEMYREMVSMISTLNTKPGFVSLAAPVHFNSSVSAAECADPSFNRAKDITSLDPKAKPITNLTDTL